MLLAFTKAGRGESLNRNLEDMWINASPEPNSGCWLWCGKVSKSGYGDVWVGDRLHRAHRVSYEIVNGPVPVGFELDHLCRVRCCINPAHIEPVTRRENTLRGVGPAMSSFRQLSKTHCRSGHPYSGDNLRILYDGRRGCRICQNRASARYRNKQSEIT